MKMAAFVCLCVLLVASPARADDALVGDLQAVAKRAGRSVVVTYRTSTGEARVSPGELTRLARAFIGPLHVWTVIAAAVPTRARQDRVYMALYPFLRCPEADPGLLVCPEVPNKPTPRSDREHH
jgi:hypothetical protein